MCGEVAVAHFPFDGRIGIAAAKPSGWQIHHLVAPFTLLHYGLTGTSVKPTTSF
jgi:hypothetical protein